MDHRQTKIFALFFCIASLISGCKPEENKSIPVQIASNHVNFVFIDPSGVKWFATDIGISSFDGKSWVNYSSKEGLPGKVFNAIESTSAANGFKLWFGSDSGLVKAFRVPDLISVSNVYTVKEFAAIRNDTIIALHRDNSNILWFGTKNGLGGLRDSSTWIAASTYVTRNYPVSGIASSSNGWNYFTTVGGGVARNKSTVDAVTGASTYETPWASLPSDSIYSLCIEKVTDNQWFGTRYGAAFHTGTETKKNWTVYTTADGLISNHINCITQDQDGNIWFGTDAGISKFNKTNFTNYSSTDGLADNYVNSMAADADGSIWIATNNGVSHFNGLWANYQAK